LIIAVLIYVLTEIIKRTPVWEKLRKWAALYILVLAMLFTTPYCIIILEQLFSERTIFLSLIQSVFVAGLNVLVYEGIAKNVKETIESKKEGQ
jgi:hypothetical protein